MTRDVAVLWVVLFAPKSAVFEGARHPQGGNVAQILALVSDEMLRKELHEQVEKTGIPAE